MAGFNLLTLSVCCFTLLVAVNAQLPNTLDGFNETEIENQLHQLAPEFNTSSLPNSEDLERLLKEKCEKNGGGEEAFQALKNQQTELQSCLEQYLNYTQIQEELEVAKKTGSMDEVFGKYCKKYPEINSCMVTVVDKIKTCLDPEEQATMNKTLLVVDELKEFLCFKDGDRIAMFIAEGGVECLESKKDQLQTCANETLGSRIPTNLTVHSLPLLLIDDRACKDFDTIRVCVNRELEQCKDSTPANIVDAFFKFLKKHIPCTINVPAAAEAAQRDSDNGSPALKLSSFTLVISLIVAKYLF